MITALGHSSIAASFAGRGMKTLSGHTGEPHNVAEGQNTLVAAEEVRQQTGTEQERDQAAAQIAYWQREAQAADTG